MNEPSGRPSADATPPQATLEVRYRRWLRCYPASYRAEREEELVDVLLAAAAPEQRHPSVAEAIDLAKGGLRAHWHVARRSPSAAAWHEAGGVLCVVLPILLALRLIPFVRFVVAWLAGGYEPTGAARGMGWGGALSGPALQGWTTPLAWLVAASAVLLGRRRLAVIAGMVGVATQASTITSWLGHGAAYRAEGAVPWLALGMVAVVLLCSPRRLAAGRGWIAARSWWAIAGTLALGALGLAFAFRNPWWLGLHAADLVWVAVAAVVAGRFARRAIDAVTRRLAVAGLSLLVVVAVGDQAHRVLNLRRTTAVDLAAELVVCLVAPALVVFGAGLTSRATALPRRGHAA